MATPDHDQREDGVATVLIGRMAGRIVRGAHPTLQAVVLFSPRARGDHRPSSDVDLLAVFPDGTDTRRAAAGVDALLPFEGLDVDIVAATPTQLAAASGDYSSVPHWAQERGIDLYRIGSSIRGPLPDPSRPS